MLEKVQKEMEFDFMGLEPLFYEAVLCLEFVPNPFSIVRVLRVEEMEDICTRASRWLEDVAYFNEYRTHKVDENTLKQFKKFVEMLQSELNDGKMFIYTPSEEAIAAFKDENGIGEYEL